MNYFKENIHFCKFFFIKNISGKQKIFFFLKLKKKSTDSVGKGFDIAQHDAVVALKKKKNKSICGLCFLGACTSLCNRHIYDTL